MRRDPRHCSQLSHANFHHHRTELQVLDLNMTQVSPTSKLHSAEVPKRPKGKPSTAKHETRPEPISTDCSSRNPQKLLPPIAAELDHRPDRTSDVPNRSRLGPAAEPRSWHLRERHHPAKHAPECRPSPQLFEPTRADLPSPI